MWMKHPEVVYSEMEEGAVLLNLESRFYYTLDAAGLEVWRAIDSARDLGDLRRALLAKFEDTGGDADRRLQQFVDELCRERLVVVADSTAPAGDTANAEVVPPAGDRRPLAGPALVKHDEPLHEMSQHPFDPQLPLAE
jgi:hypothetical protein